MELSWGIKIWNLNWMLGFEGNLVVKLKSGNRGLNSSWDWDLVWGETDWRSIGMDNIGICWSGSRWKG